MGDAPNDVFATVEAVISFNAASHVPFHHRGTDTDRSDRSRQPSDPSWVAGIYDGADGDDVVSLIYDTAGVEAVPLGSVLPLRGSFTVLPVSSPGAIHGFPLHQFTRGPPFSCSLIISDMLSRLRRPAGFHAHIALRSVARLSDSVRMRAFYAPTGDDGRLRELASNRQFARVW